MKVYNFSKVNKLTKKDAKQLSKAIESFKKGEERPKGRFEVLKELKKSEF